MTKHSLSMRILLTSASLLASTVAFAQQSDRPADAETSATGIQDIVVTARRTEERLQTTPVAVTAIDSSALETNQI